MLVLKKYYRFRLLLALVLPGIAIAAFWLRIGLPTFSLFPEVWYLSEAGRTNVNGAIRWALVLVPSLLAYMFSLYAIAITRVLGLDVSQSLTRWRAVWTVLESGSSSKIGSVLSKSCLALTGLAAVFLVCLWSIAPPSSTKVSTRTSETWREEAATSFDSNRALAKRRLNLLMEEVSIKAGSTQIRRKVGEASLAAARAGLNASLAKARQADTIEEIVSAMPGLIDILSRLEALE